MYEDAMMKPISLHANLQKLIYKKGKFFPSVSKSTFFSHAHVALMLI